MKISLVREVLLEPLSVLNTISSTRNISFPILANILFIIKTDRIILTSTDLEIELSVSILNESSSQGEYTISCRKLHDIVKNFPEGSLLNFSFSDTKLSLSSGRSRFVLTLLPAIEFPLFESEENFSSFSIKHCELKKCISATEFCMAYKDVRHYLNGLLFELHNHKFICVTTDGHRLAYFETEQIENCNFLELSESSKLQVLMPRKSILDVMKLLNDSDDLVSIQITNGYVKFIINSYTLISKLIDSKFPEYSRVIPDETNLSININRIELRDLMYRAAILSTEKFKAIRLEFSDSHLSTSLHNPEHEEMKEDLIINYTGLDFNIGFNIHYIIEALNHLDTTNVIFNFTESLNSCIIHADDDSELPLYVVMPMRL